MLSIVHEYICTDSPIRPLIDSFGSWSTNSCMIIYGNVTPSHCSVTQGCTISRQLYCTVVQTAEYQTTDYD